MRTLILLIGISAPLAAQDDPEATLSRLLREWRPEEVEDTSELSLDEKIQVLLPTENEDKWLKIPWRTDLLQARREAVEQGKPVFLWLMDGDPMSCT